MITRGCHDAGSLYFQKQSFPVFKSLAQIVNKYHKDSGYEYDPILWGSLLLLSAVTTYFIYAKGFTAGWTFDDTKYLHSLSQVHDLAAAIIYLLQEKGISITDRPIAMASFLLNVNDWPNNQGAFRQINVSLHIFNGFLVALVARQVARLIPRLSTRQNGFAVTLAAVWMLHPLLASTSFHIIQRMVLLAATFSLIGIAMYLYGRARLVSGKRNGYAWMTAGMIVGAGLGTLAKETAALTPLLIMVLEFTVLNRYAPVSDQFLRSWRLIFFAGPALALAVYGGYYLHSIAPDTYLIRPFTLEERIHSQSTILFEYVRQILLPNVSMMGPFQDDTWRIRDAGSVTWLALAAWLTLTMVAIIWRHRFIALSFGVLFFLTGHLLESTFFSLELYFEHRNYLPSLGPIGAITAVAWSGVARWPRYLIAGFAVLMALLLVHTSTTWGDREQSALFWQQKHPSSARATQNLATYYQAAGNFDEAALTIIRGYQNNPLDGALALNAFISMCFDTSITKEKRSIPAQVAIDAPRIHFSAVVTKTLHNQINLFAQGQCDSFDAEQLISIASGFLKNPAYQKPKRQYGLLMAIARALETQERKAEATAAKIRAFRAQPTIEVAHTVFQELIEYGKPNEAHEFLNEARQRAPLYKNQYDAWEKTVSDG